MTRCRRTRRPRRRTFKEETMEINAFHMISALLGLALATASVAADLKPLQDRHLGAGRDHFPGLDGGGRPALREGTRQGGGVNMEGAPGRACRTAQGKMQGMHVWLAGATPAILAPCGGPRPATPSRSPCSPRPGSAWPNLQDLGISTFGWRPTSPSASCSSRLGLPGGYVTISQIGGSSQLASPRWSPAASMSRR